MLIRSIRNTHCRGENRQVNKCYLLRYEGVFRQGKYQEENKKMIKFLSEINRKHYSCQETLEVFSFHLKAIHLLTPLLKLHSTSWNPCDKWVKQMSPLHGEGKLGYPIIITEDSQLEKIREKCVVKWQATKNIEHFLKIYQQQLHNGKTCHLYQ